MHLSNLGGLVLLNDQASDFFVLLEKECQMYLNIHTIAASQNFDIKGITEDLIGSDEIVVPWSEMT